MSERPSARKALILSPSASHPQDYGNRNRVFQTTSWLKNAGFEIHFLLYPYESDWVHGVPDSAADMRRAWDSFTVIPPSRPLHAPPQGSHHEIDEWWDLNLGAYLEWVFAREAFDVFVVNYTFFSKAFEYAPRNVIKILETHDIFSGRKELFLAHGAEPEFFYTTPDQEKQALDRADIIVAIKDGEAEHLRTLTTREVVSVPFDVVERPVARRAGRLETTDVLRIGFVGALNTVNVLNMARFLEKFARVERIYVPPQIEILVAGNVCSKLRATSASVKLLGHVPSIEEYYENIDVVVAPMSFSTGIKIKVGEALSFGKPVVSTQNGFDGFPSTDEFHALDGVDAVCRALMKLAFDRERLKVLETHSETAARLARRRSATGYQALTRAIGRLSKAVVFVTDQALWKAETIEQERLAQWAEFCCHLTRTVIVYIGEEPIEAIARGNKILTRNSRVIDARGDAATALNAIDELTESYSLIDIVISAGGGNGLTMWNGLRGKFDAITLDTWVPELARIACIESAALQSDIGLTGSAATRCLSTTALRYLPESLRKWSASAPSSEILAVLCGAEQPDILGLDVLELFTGSRRGRAMQTYSYGISREEDLLRELGQRDRPAILLAVGRNMHAVEACRSIAASAEIQFLHLSSGQMPMVIVTGEGSPVLCSSFADIAALLPDLIANGQRCTSEHPKDTGWSSYWRQLSHL